MNSNQRTNINDINAVKKLYAFRQRQYAQAVIEIKQRPNRAPYLRSVVLPTIIRKGKWAAAQLERLNAKEAQQQMTDEQMTNASLYQGVNVAPNGQQPIYVM